MRLDYHPAVQRDFHEAIDFYEAAGPRLADRFEAEFRHCVAAIGKTPRRFGFYGGSSVCRRVRLRSFPYVIVYRERADAVRVLVLKHEKRAVTYGVRRS